MNKAQMRVLLLAVLWSSAGSSFAESTAPTYGKNQGTLEVTEFLPSYQLFIDEPVILDTNATRNTRLTRFYLSTDSLNDRTLAARFATSDKQQATKDGTEATISSDDNQDNQITVELKMSGYQPVTDDNGDVWLSQSTTTLVGSIMLASDDVKPGNYSIALMGGDWQE